MHGFALFERLVYHHGNVYYTRSRWSEIGYGWLMGPQDSPPWYPSPRGGTVKRWADSYSKAKGLVERMSLVEKVNVTTGTGWEMGLCVGNTGKMTLF